MKTLVTLFAFAAAVWAAPTDFGRYPSVVKKLSEGVIREKKAPTFGLLTGQSEIHSVGEHNPGDMGHFRSPGIVPILTDPIHLGLKPSPLTGRTHKIIKKPVIIYKPHRPHHYRSYFRDSSEQTSDEQQNCKKLKDQLKSCLMKNSKSAVIENVETWKPSNIIIDSSKMNKQAAGDNQNKFQILDTSDKKSDSEEVLQRKIEAVKQAIEQVQRSIEVSKNETERFSQWKNQKEEIEHSVENEAQEIQLPITDNSNQNVSLDLEQRSSNINDLHEEKFNKNLAQEIKVAVKDDKGIISKSLKNHNFEQNETEFDTFSFTISPENKLLPNMTSNMKGQGSLNYSTKGMDNKSQVSAANKEQENLDSINKNGQIVNSNLNNGDTNYFFPREKITTENNAYVIDNKRPLEKSQLNEFEYTTEKGVNILKDKVHPSALFDNLEGGSSTHNVKLNNVLSLHVESSKPNNSQSHSIKSMSLKSVMDDNEQMVGNSDRISTKKLEVELKENSNAEFKTLIGSTQQFIEATNKNNDIHAIHDSEAALFHNADDIVNPEFEKAFLTEEKNLQMGSASAPKIKSIVEPFEVTKESIPIAFRRRDEGAKKKFTPKMSARGVYESYGYGSSASGTGLGYAGATGAGSVSETGDSAIGVFPLAKVGDCAIPILMGCSPSILSGNLLEHQSAYATPISYKKG
ncbi:hypothetical protein EVAR_96616_1 [Eumeta japonica]|uniref:Uncharacterized protein n=1 Tax=Eumeta variegata TaxID=151549 RepID=A0A4C1WRB9_EUMVA|nr:hypothetical protein EVAR_96616_1 [Eumeta japonica]